MKGWICPFCGQWFVGETGKEERDSHIAERHADQKDTKEGKKKIKKKIRDV